MSYDNELPRGYFELNGNGKAHLLELCKFHGLNFERELKDVNDSFYYYSPQGWREIFSHGSFELTFTKDLRAADIKDRYIIETFYTNELQRVREYKLNSAGLNHLSEFCRRYNLDFNRAKNMIEFSARKYNVFKQNGLTWHDEQFTKKEFY